LPLYVYYTIGWGACQVFCYARCKATAAAIQNAAGIYIRQMRRAEYLFILCLYIERINRINATTASVSSMSLTNVRFSPLLRNRDASIINWRLFMIIPQCIDVNSLTLLNTPQGGVFLLGGHVVHRFGFLLLVGGLTELGRHLIGLVHGQTCPC
jgi:hypothetical protein